MSNEESRPESILSHGERAVARHLRDRPDATAEAIAEERGVDPGAVEKSIARIREKTARAVATLDQSPFVEEVAGEFDEATRERIVTALSEGIEE